MRTLDHRIQFLMMDEAATDADIGEAILDATGLSLSDVMPPSGPTLEFLARCSTKTAPHRIKQAGGEILGVIAGTNSVVVGRAPLSLLSAISELRGVERVEMARPLADELDLSRIDTRVEPLHISADLGDTPIRGEGAVVGIIDTGIDYHHPKFRNDDGTSRILFLWDQRATMNSAGNVPFGREYTKADLDAVLAQQQPTDSVPHEDENGHGTHVAAIAAGNGRRGLSFRGIAPDADLIVVASRSDAGSLGQSTSALLAYNYLIDRAGDQPIAINQSQGMNGGGHFGETVLETGIDSLLRQNGVVAIKSAGNEQQWRIHAGGNLAQDAEVSLDFDVPQFVQRRIFLELWFDDLNVLDLSIRPPNEAELPIVTANADLGPVSSTTATGNNVAIIVERDLDGTGETQVTIALARGTASIIRPGTWRLKLKGRQIADGRYDVWIERARRRFPVQQARFTAASAENQRTISIPGTTRRIITVGAYVTRSDSPANPTGDIAKFSSRGPTRLGVRKPEIAAPGQSIIAARSASSTRPSHPDSLHTAMSGTSMAAPHVAGAAALLLSESPNLTSDQVKQILVRSARTDGFSESAPDDTWGAGKLDAEAAITLLETVKFPAITSVEVTDAKLSLTTDIETTVTVSYHTSLRRVVLGKSLGSEASLSLSTSHTLDFSTLPAGTYFCEIRLFSIDAFWTIDDNDGAGHRVTVV